MSKVLYIGWFGLPETAAGIRVLEELIQKETLFKEQWA